MNETNAFKTTVPVQNSNCLVGMRCPVCKSTGPFDIESNTMFRVYDDGTESHTDAEWDGNSATVCCKCHYFGNFLEFQFPYQCQNCGFGFEEEDIEKLPVQFPDIPHLLERIAPGESVPYGECPECGSLVHSIE